jgi:hypothetical protein
MSVDKGALVLVVIMPETRDMEIARVLGWYRVPLRRAPKVIGVDYLAFYQPGAFGPDQRWQVSSYARVLGYELTTRAELFRDQADHPRAHEEYYKISLGPLETLPQPIPAGRWRRLTFLYTTGDLLMRAQSLKDLVVRSEEREILWRALRERALKGGEYKVEELPEGIDEAVLALLGGLVNV